ncbi:hypothetical protein AGMMS49940_13800 [Spirochaetia bacterium]|nr:hypothetical protein AGMMS49940_13800 [Spirochaetia bacterium]
MNGVGTWFPFSADMIRGLLSSAAPLMLGSLGALFTELSGALGIFIEGFMALGSFFSWIFAGWTGSVPGRAPQKSKRR